MERMEEYQRMREEEAGRPVPAELACLETRVRARAAKRPRRRRGPVLAAVCLCLVLGTGMAWAWAVSPRWTGCWGKTRDS